MEQNYKVEPYQSLLKLVEKNPDDIYDDVGSAKAWNAFSARLEREMQR